MLALYQRSLAKSGRVDMLINNAAERCTPGRLARHLHSMCGSFVPDMIKPGSSWIVNMASLAGLLIWPGYEGSAPWIFAHEGDAWRRSRDEAKFDVDSRR